MISTIIWRVAYCGVGYLHAAFVAAIAITVCRAARDLYLNGIDLSDVPLYLVALTCIMTLANILAASTPALIVIAALEVARAIYRFPFLWSLYMIAGAAHGYRLAVQTLDISTLEVVFHIVSWTLGGLAFWHMSQGPRRPVDQNP